MSNEIILSHSNNHVTADSRMVANHFKKQHGHILRDLAQLEKDVSNFGEMFYETTFPDSYGRPQKHYLLTRDGFTLLVMGFTGKAALEWKLKYIKAFNEMENQYNSKPLSQLEILAQSAQLLLEQDKRLTVVEEKQTAMIDAITDLAQIDWAADMNRRVNGMCKTYGLNDQTFRSDMYRTLEATARCNLAARKRNLQERMKQSGAKYADIKAINKLQVVADDPKLRAIFEGIVRTQQMKYAGKKAI